MLPSWWTGGRLAVFGDLVGLTSGFETSQLELTVGGSAPKLNLPGKRPPPTVVLKRGMTTRDGALGLARRCDPERLSGVERRNDCDVRLRRFGGRQLVLVNAWPSKVEIETETLAGGGARTSPSRR